jgi:histidine triad (HIT) family protein
MNNTKCDFCQIIDGKLPGVEVYRDEICIVIMDIFPTSPGHLMVIPLVHAQYSHELTPQVRSHIFEKGALLSSAVCRSNLKAKGANLIINDGKAASQHIPHLHLHVIPRYGNDLLFVLIRLFTRFFNPFARIGMQKRLERQAGDIRKVLG